MLGIVDKVIPQENFITIVGIFFVYSILGWLVESFYMSICNRKLTNRGFIKGPICPIYGMGEFLVYALLAPFAGNYIVLFFTGMFIATTLELFTAKIMIKKLGFVWWDYTNKPFNYKGILCLESTIGWGIYTIVEFAFLRNAVVKMISMTPRRLLIVGIVVLSTYYMFAFALSLRRIAVGEIEVCENNLRAVNDNK